MLLPRQTASALKILTYCFKHVAHCWFAEIQKLVLSGRMGEAIETTQQLYPNLLERNPDLLFMLK